MELVWSLSRYVLPVVTIIILVKCIMTLMLGHPKEKIYGYIIDMTDGHRYPLNMWETSVGRSKSCDIVLPYDSVARSHAVITRRIDGWYIHDLLTKAVLKVNGHNVELKSIIRNGDIIELGKNRFRFEIINDPVQNVGRKTGKAKKAQNRVDSNAHAQQRKSAPAKNTAGFYDENNKPELNFTKKRPAQPPAYNHNPDSFTVETSVRPQQKKKAKKHPRVVNAETGEIFLLCGNEVTVGSGKKCDIRLRSGGVEKLHCLLVLYEDGWAVEREKGRTLLNGKEIKNPQLLFCDDVIAVNDERLYYYD